MAPGGGIVPPSPDASSVSTRHGDAHYIHAGHENLKPVVARCTPPPVTVSYQFQAATTADVKARFEAFLVVFVDAYRRILAERGHGTVVVEAGRALTAAASGPVAESVDTRLERKEELSWSGYVGLECAGGQLREVRGVIARAGTGLEDLLTRVDWLRAALRK